MSSFFRRKDDKILLRNGAILLEKLNTTGNGKHNPIRSFSEEELKLATNNYDAQQLLIDTTESKLYKGLLQNRQISVMKFGDVWRPDHKPYFNNVVFASQTNHKNVLKLTGCCLETQIPNLVFEPVQYGTLDDRIYCHRFEPLLWKHRLKIAMEVANAVTYLHIGLPRPIVFADIKPSKILFDEHHVAKLFDFSLSESIPEGETHIKNTMVRGTFGFLAPEFYSTRNLNEKCDVYSFGGLLLVLLTRKRIFYSGRYEIDEMIFYDANKYYESYRINEIVDPTIVQDGLCFEREMLLYDYVKNYNENNRIIEMVDPLIFEDGLFLEREQQLYAFTELALKCMSSSAEERPAMIDVAKQLRKLYLSA